MNNIVLELSPVDYFNSQIGTETIKTSTGHARKSGYVVHQSSKLVAFFTSKKVARHAYVAMVRQAAA